jgi:hypothetical protein
MPAPDPLLEATSPKTSLPGFHVRSKVAAPARALFDLLMNVEGIETWAYGISEAHLVKHTADGADLLYLYSNTPWPVRDRDMVVRRVGEVSPDQQIFRIAWRCISDPAVKGRDNVLRVRSCDSEFVIRRIDDTTSSLDYRVRIDPAGALPDWAGRWFARRAPRESLASIVRRVNDPSFKR